LLLTILMLMDEIDTFVLGNAYRNQMRK